MILFIKTLFILFYQVLRFFPAYLCTFVLGMLLISLLSKSRHFQPTPVQTIDKTINTVNGREEVRKKDCEEREHETLLVSPLPSFLLVIVGYNKSIVQRYTLIKISGIKIIFP